ncbi:hypothetical protein BC835DRAFT_1411452 [Cytidiella melzeri]|nr:hypothetical protein BC835DRAFT_1411452 [Cytidiella melzeri]
MSRHIPEHNQVLLDNHHLHEVLHDLSERLFRYFAQTVRLVIHGGAVMVLHKSLKCRQSTRDVDYLHRSFETEWKRRGVNDAGERLNACIAATAEHFGLGLDWMNAHADVALPMAYNEYAQLYDPIYADAVQPANVSLNTVYKSRGLQLIGVGWSWAVALKLVRYQKDDPRDIAAILQLGSQLKGLQWTRQIMEDWLLNMCSPMGYANYPPEQIELTRQKMRDAVKRAQGLPWPSQPPASRNLLAQSAMSVERPTTTHPSSEHSSSHDRHKLLRQRTKSFSHLPPHSAPPLLATSSMPSLATPHPTTLGRSQLPRPDLPGSARPMSMVQVPITQLPVGFIPYYVSPPPVQSFQQRSQHHPSASQRIRV